MKTVLAISVAFAAGFALAYKRDAIYDLFTAVVNKRRDAKREHVTIIESVQELEPESTSAESTEEPIVAEEAQHDQVFQWRTTRDADQGIYKVYMTIFVLELFNHK